MAPFHQAIWAAGLFLELLIVFRGWRTRAFQHYPYFYTYLAYVVLRTVCLYVLLQLKHPAYASVYWHTNTVSLVLFFLVPLEILRHVFRPSHAVKQLAGYVFVAVLLLFGLWILFDSTSPNTFYADLERKLSLAHGVCLLTILLLGRFYALPLGRNVWGLALGFGIYVSVSILNFSALDLLKSFLPVWQLVRPISFDAMLAVWAWALWSPSSSPEPVVASPQLSMPIMSQWQQRWDDLLTVMRKGIGL
ncbi:MAG: hypothetical protein L0338_34605 [Acidobacteria bacterium]|nr:hypothetical protein [Acidobacteriota bacterium]